MFKKGEEFKASKYIPVSSPCGCLKLMEHAAMSQVMEYFDQHNIVVNYWHGFWKQKSCKSRLLGLTQ